MKSRVGGKLHKATTTHVLRALQEPPIEIVRAKWRPIGFEWDVTFPGGKTVPAMNKEEVYTLVAGWLLENWVDRYSLVWEEEQK